MSKGLLGISIATCCVVLLVACLATPFGPPGGPGRLTNNSPPVSPLAPDAGPHFTQITTSRQSFVKSDCAGTSITVTSTITAAAGIAQVMLWYRVGDQQPFTAVAVAHVGNDRYAVTVKGTDVPGSEYGVWAFYLTADDKAGRHGQSALDTSVQFLPCVG